MGSAEAVTEAIEQLSGAGTATLGKTVAATKANQLAVHPMNPTGRKLLIREISLPTHRMDARGRDEFALDDPGRAGGRRRTCVAGAKRPPVQAWKFSEEQDKLDARPGFTDARCERREVGRANQHPSLERPRRFFATRVQRARPRVDGPARSLDWNQKASQPNGMPWSGRTQPAKRPGP